MLTWRSEEKLAQRPRRRLKKATGSIVKMTDKRIYIAFFDTESNREEYASSPVYKSISSSKVHFEAFQFDSNYPDFCDGLWISWHVTDYNSNHTNKEDSVLIFECDPYYPEPRENTILNGTEIVATYVPGNMEFYGYFVKKEKAYNDFLDELEIVCWSRIQQIVQAPKLFGIYATCDQDTGFWTRVQVTMIYNRFWIYGSFIDLGGDDRLVSTRDMIFLPDYIAEHDRFINRFHVAGCQANENKDLISAQLLMIDLFKNEEFTLKCHGQVKQDRILVDVLLKNDQYLSQVLLDEKLAVYSEKLVPELC